MKQQLIKHIFCLVREKEEEKEEEAGMPSVLATGACGRQLPFML